MSPEFSFAAIATLVTLFFSPLSARATEDAGEIAKKLSNPVASLISVPFQFNYDQNIGPDEKGTKTVLNVQPVMPFSINGEWKIISRTILPFVWQNKIVPGENADFGLGDITQSFFFSPKAESGLTWGVGPVLLLPTATENLMGGEKWGAGPTGVVLKQTPGANGGHWTYGVMANHIWSFAGKDDRRDINATFFQPFLALTTADAWTYNVDLEGAYDWEGNEASIPINLGVAKLVKFGKLPVSFQGGVGYWLDSPQDTGPEGFRFRASVTFVLPGGA